MKALLVLMLGCMVGFSAWSQKEPTIYLISKYPFKPHNNYVEAYYNGDKFLNKTDYIKVGIIELESKEDDLNTQVSVLKKFAQGKGADGIFIMGINENGLTTASKYDLGKDVTDLLASRPCKDYYTLKSSNTIVALAIKFKRNLDPSNTNLKTLKLYRYNSTTRSYDLLETYTYSYDKKLVSGDTKNQEYQKIEEVSTQRFTDNGDIKWRRIIKASYYTRKDYVASNGSKMSCAIHTNSDGSVKSIIIRNTSTNQQDSIAYRYFKNKLVGRTIVSASAIEEEVISNQGNQEEVYTYRIVSNERHPELLIVKTYYTAEDIEQLAVTPDKQARQVARK